MEFRFGTDVRRRDGERLGTLQSLLLETETDEVVMLITQHSGFDNRSSPVPFGSVEHADRDGIDVDLTMEQFDTLQAAPYEENIAPPPDAMNIDRDEVTDPIDVPDVVPVGAATGVESISFTPILQETVEIPEGQVEINGRTEVWATDGRLGHLDGVVVSDQTRRVDRLIIKEGLIFTHEVQTDRQDVSTLAIDRITLSVPKDALEHDHG